MIPGIILIGMPGAGKSTIGVVLSKALGLNFVDTDIAIQVKTGKTLQAIIDAQGYEPFLAIEEQILMATDPCQQVVATGGSAVYSAAGMAHLKRNGSVVYLRASLSLLESRLHNYATRGIARQGDQSIGDLYRQRCALYEHYADVVVNCDGRDVETLVKGIAMRVGNFR